MIHTCPDSKQLQASVNGAAEGLSILARIIADEFLAELSNAEKQMQRQTNGEMHEKQCDNNKGF